MLIARQVGADSGAVGTQITGRSGADSKASGGRQWGSWSRPQGDRVLIARQVEPTVGQLEQITGRSGAGGKASGSDSGAFGADHRAIGC